MVPLNYDLPFQKYLRPGEQLLWVGRPPIGILFRKGDWVAIPFGVACFAVSACIMAVSLGLTPRSTFNACTTSIVLPVVAIAMYMAFGRFWYDADQRRRTWYGVTNQRALILYVGKLVCLNGIALDEEPRVTIETHANGTATLLFKPQKMDPYWEGREGRSGFLDFGRPTQFAFEFLPDAVDVCRLIRQQMPEPEYLRKLEEMNDGGAAEKPSS